MKNRIEITSDGINAYAKIQVNASKIGIRVLSVLLVIELILIGWIFSNLKADETLSMAVPFLIIIIFFVGLPVRFLLWNVYGNEYLTVNTKSISWSYDYGFFRTNLKTVKYDRLGTGYERIRGDEEKEVGRLIFYNYRREDNLPEQIHQTSVLLTKEEIEEFDEQITQVFIDEFYNESGFIPFSIN